MLSCLEAVHFEVGDAAGYDVGIHGHEDMYSLTQFGIGNFRGTVCLFVSLAKDFLQIVAETVVTRICRMFQTL